jgi:hypothetical protein
VSGICVARRSGWSRVLNEGEFMAKKTVPFDPDGIGKLPDDKPVVYKILDEEGNNIYTGSAKRGRVKDRLSEHLAGGPDAIRGGAKVEIEQQTSIDEAQAKEGRIIARAKPPLNKQGK